ncbi:recombination directionality factor [Alicyclobacillus kakegawensis]|uniref:recombination directionality factor n=1 Tax=Alicyclobacillus kakegawensis TaxID=392012 RepID=UPI00082A791D|nr:hypothetical protein [Alicyclobacillus kakegawensis]
MPIKGFSDVQRIPRVGKIHLGVRKTNDNGKDYPTAVDYFVVKPDASTSKAAAKAFHDVYGDKPKEITIAFPSNDPEQFFPQWLSSYRGGNGRYELYCQGDGEVARRSDGEGGKVQIQCLYRDCPIYQAGKCKELGRLQFFLPDVPGIGVWQIDTTSFHTTVNLNGSIQMIRALTGGRIAMIPLKLRIVPKVVNPDGKSKTVYVLTLGIDDLRLTDFLKQTPLLAASTPNVEPIPENELPEDLFINANLVDEEDVGESTDHVTDEDTSSAQSDTNVSTDEDIAAVAKVECRRNQSNKEVARAKLATIDGQLLEVLTDDPKLIRQLKPLKEGTAIRFRTAPSQKWQNRMELIDFAIVS